MASRHWLNKLHFFPGDGTGSYEDIGGENSLLEQTWINSNYLIVAQEELKKSLAKESRGEEMSTAQKINGGGQLGVVEWGKISKGKWKEKGIRI